MSNVKLENDIVDLIPREVAKLGSKEIVPGYSVVLPHSKMELTIRGLSVGEEDNIRGCMTSPKRIFNTLFHTLYSCILTADKEKYKDQLSTYELFIKNVSTTDRDALLFGLIGATYDTKNETSLTCGTCKTQFKDMCDIEAIQKITIADRDNILSERPVLEIPDLGWKVILKIPTLANELGTLTSDSNGKPTNSNTAAWIFVDSIQITAKSDRGDSIPHIADNPAEIYGIIQSVPAKYGKMIKKEWIKHFGDFGIRAIFETVCPSCNSEVAIEVNPLNHFFVLVE